MAYKFPNVSLNKDGMFGPTANNHYYQPAKYHNRSARIHPGKTKWIIKQNEQYEIFRLGDEGEWICNVNRGLFSLLDNGQVIMGVNEERLSFFPTPSNLNDAWHGYPVNSGEYEPSVELVDFWLKEEIIDQRVSIKILRGEF